MDPEEFEKSPSSSVAGQPQHITLQRAVDLGEYNPEYLSTFAEWQELTPHLQWRLVHQAIKNRRTSLMVNWAEVANHPNFSQKPHLKKIHESIEKQLKDLQNDEERLENFYLGNNK